jgi:trehalose utilization protein
MSGSPIRALVWNEFIHEREDARVRLQYPDGLHQVIAASLRAVLGEQVRVATATLDEPEHGLSEPVLAATDVLLWWGHMAHQRVSDTVAARVQARVLEGMGLVVLHSGHLSKPFTRLMVTSCALRWREAGDRELVWTVNPGHPIAAGVPHPMVIPQQEMYGEYFDIPQPDDLVFISSFSGGEVFRSGCCFTRGQGRIFYFSPGHETYPVYHQAPVQRVLANAVLWTAEGARARYDTRECYQSPTDWFEQQG